jgi:UDP-N-acetylmuramyl pentapeptide phosphotransferase/UDP-N-acetylglucosamine-1-phosphate transferase
MTIEPFTLAGLTLIASAALSAAIIVLLLPFLRRHALATPNQRSSHRAPVPQGGGAAVIIATVAVAAVVLWSVSGGGGTQLIVVFSTALALAIVGAVDDVISLEALPRLLLQSACVAIVVAALPPELRILPILPFWTERLAIFIAGLWFVNLVNFMDGIDWMMVAEVVPVTLGVSIFSFAGALSWDVGIVALALCGGIAGFAPFNRPVARLFLGDVGSLPIGLLLGWQLAQLAGSHLTAAILLPLYYVADATLTLLARSTRGEPVMQAHRSHFYQRAMDRGMTAYQIVGYVFVVNVVLIVLATTTLFFTSHLAHAAALGLGCLAVGLLLFRFSR